MFDAKTQTVVLQISHYLCQYKNLVCPITYNEDIERSTTDCTPSVMFQLTTYELPGVLSFLFRIVSELRKVCERIDWITWLFVLIQFRLPRSVETYPFVLHSLSLSLFSSVIGPFGGFFASGFKRAFKIKDFGDIIPGHGGIMDRFDCQYLMATFVNVYISSFISAPNPQKLFQQLVLLKSEDMLTVYESLREHLINRGLLGDALGELVTEAIPGWKCMNGFTNWVFDPDAVVRC